MKTKFFIIIDAIYPDNTGGKKIPLGRVFEAKNNGFDVVVLHYNYTQVQTDVSEKFFLDNKITYCSFTPDSHRVSFLTRGYKYIKSIFNLIPEPSYYVKGNTKFKRFLLDKVNEFNPCEISIESIFLYPIAEILSNLDVKYEIIFQNVESSLYKQLCFSSKSLFMKIYFLIESLKLNNVENKLFLGKDENRKFVFLTQNDFNSYTEKYPDIQFEYSINKNYLFLNNSISRNVNNKNSFFLFPGGLSYPPNRFGLEWLLKNVVSKLKSDGINIYVTGSTDDKIKDYFSKYENVTLLGYVSDDELNRLYGECIAVISPIMTGAGIKIKNLEAIALGIPLIANDFSLIGVSTDNQNVYRTDDDPNKFYEKMKDVYNNILSK